MNKDISSISIEDYFSEGGILEKNLENYQYREEQERMTKDIEEVIESSGKCILEAGTGIGKSLSYLFPTSKEIASSYTEIEKDIRLYKEKDDKSGVVHKKVVISTSTKNLQDQLFKKDFPLLRDSTNSSFIKSAVLYGRGNYICKMKLIDAMSLYSFRMLDHSLQRKIREYINDKKSNGYIGDIEDEGSQKFFSSCLSDSITCQEGSCQYINNCYLYNARREANAADIIFTNHHVVLQDARIRLEEEENFTTQVVLPGFDILVVDEAHDFSSVATSVFGDEFEARSLLVLINAVTKSNSILLNSLSGCLKEGKSIINIEKEINAIREELYLVDERLTSLTSVIIPGVNDIYFKREWYDRYFPNNDKELFLNFVTRVNNLFNTIHTSFDNGNNEKEEENLQKLYSYFEKINKLVFVLKAWVTFSDFDNLVSSVERVEYIKGDSEKVSVLLRLSLLNTHDALKRAINDKLSTVIYCSATLTICDSFNYYINSLGLTEEGNLKTGRYNSPFDYKRILDLEIYKNGPKFSVSDSSIYDEYLSLFISKSISLIGGGVLVLFTSYKMLKSVYEKVSKYLNGEYTLLKQGDVPNKELLKRFKEERESVLFGTDSFYQGIDVPGDALRMVIVTKLPFPNLLDPIIAAKSDVIERMGGDYFYDLFLPMCIIKLKQGCGRLIRNESDKGIVVILDSRVINKWKSYGSYVVKSLQGGNLNIVESIDGLLNNIERFYF